MVLFSKENNKILRNIHTSMHNIKVELYVKCCQSIKQLQKMFNCEKEKKIAAINTRFSGLCHSYSSLILSFMLWLAQEMNIKKERYERWKDQWVVKEETSTFSLLLLLRNFTITIAC